MVILSRTFCDTAKITDPEEQRARFADGVQAIRACEAQLAAKDAAFFAENHRIVQEKVQAIVEKIKASKGLC